nr:MAG TPA: hypothetical protein [Bacteriophage sp.]
MECVALFWLHRSTSSLSRKRTNKNTHAGNVRIPARAN